MLYYKYEFICESEPLAGNKYEEYRAYTGLIDKSKDISNDMGRHHYHDARQWVQFFISDISGQNVIIGGVADRMDSGKLACLADDFFTRLGLAGKRVDSRELTNCQMMELDKSATAKGFIESDEEIGHLSFFDADRFGHDSDSKEWLIDKVFTKKQALAQCRSLLCGASWRTEMERIFAGRSPRGFLAHPVHYAIDYRYNGMTTKATNLLLGSLYQAGRLQSRRVLQVSLTEFDVSELLSIYVAQEGGAIVLCDFGQHTKEEIRELADLIRDFRRSVLTIMEFWHCGELRETYMKEMDGVSIVWLDYDSVASPEAIAYLKLWAKRDGIKNRASLLSSLPADKSEYYMTELERLYDSWYDEYLRSRFFTQYRDISIAQRGTDIDPQADAFEQLMAMTGLAEAKAVIRQMIDFHQAQMLMEQRGIKGARPAMHMVFTGDPGTAKTTVARLVARIMRDKGLLSVGDLIEVGRADLVARYVGHTALKVRALFEKARGSVLFIDEAYSLVDDRRGLFGDEAINTIVQEMENMREDMAVIFAGYPDKMEGFLRLNPGLRSRIAFHVPFADYSVDELIAILEQMAAAEGMTLDEQARCKVYGIIEAAMGQEDFGNGRFCRNLFQQAKMGQASRLMARMGEDISDEYLRTLTAADFDLPAALTPRQSVQTIGFRAS